ncbi:vitelline membrane outer layer protein 1 homolog [Clupea harengus]|uniref:Vitelline membrane outer layer protein 1 homolog n=1 Tax=Clupea harengus TaxID=7950 RepID=A0A6P8G5P4_CLUHA|nr:vitelline membrane outer layer protein 1 homolog [Clupea harengus]
MKLIFALLVILPLAFPSEGSQISVSNGGYWGGWGGMEMCPPSYRAFGFSLKVEEKLGSGDDTALNGIRLLCRHRENRNLQVTISSSEGRWGSWTHYQDCGYAYLLSFVLRVERPRGGRVDDTAANNIQFKCSDGRVLYGGGQTWGDWGKWSGLCYKGICGIMTRVEGPVGREDDTALNDVQFRCC